MSGDNDVPEWAEKLIDCPNCGYEQPIKSENVTVDGRNVDFDCPECGATTSFRKVISEIDL